MTSVERFGFLTKEQEKVSVDEIITYFENERGEEMGQIGAGEVLDFFMLKIAPLVYNKGIEDARDKIKSSVDDMDYSVSTLRQG